MNPCIKIYLLDCSYDEGECWAIVTAPSVKLAESVFYNQTRFHGAKVITIQELNPLSPAYTMACEGTNREVFNKYISILQGEFKGSLQALKEFLKGKQGDKGDKGDKGEKGDTGERGPIGPQGPKGEDADTSQFPTWGAADAKYLSQSNFESTMQDMLGLDAEGISELVRILSDEDTTTGLITEIAKKADKSDIVQSDWNQSTVTAKDYIKNKPNIRQIAQNIAVTTSNICPISISEYSNAQDAIDGYPPVAYTKEYYNDNDITGSIEFSTVDNKFYLAVFDNNSDAEYYYTQWYAGDDLGLNLPYPDSKDFLKTSGIYLDALGELWYISIPANKCFKIVDDNQYEQADWNQTHSWSKSYIKNKPTIPAAQIQSDWNQTSTTALDYIKNKPTIPSIEDSTRLLPMRTISWEDDAESEDDYPPVAYTYSYLHSHPNITVYPCFVLVEGFYLRVEDSSTGNITYYSKWYAGESYGFGSYPSSDYYVSYKFYIDLGNDYDQHKIVYINGDEDGAFAIISDKENVYERNPCVLPITSVVSTVPSRIDSTDHVRRSYSEIVLCTANNQIYAKIANTYYTQWYDQTLNSVYYYDRRFYRSTTNNTDNTVNPALYHLVGTNTIYNYKTSSNYDVIDLRCQADWNQNTNTAQDYIKNKPNLATVATSGNYNDLSNKPTIPSVSSKEDKMSIETASGATLSAQVNKYYRFDSAVGTLAITLPVPTDTLHISSIIFSLTTDSTTAVTFHSSANIRYQAGYAIAASTSYEINALYNGSAWVIMANEITPAS
jgi:hypothetical protein